MEGSSEGTQTVARFGHSFLLPMERGVYMDLDPGEVSTREFQWMVRRGLAAGLGLTLDWLCRCNAYNVASAGACFLGLVFGLSVFFDVKDLHQSRASPRTRI